MATLAELRDRIADELTRPDLAPQIEKAVSSAIRFYQRRRFTFTDGRNLAFTAADTEFYTMPDLRAVDSIQFQDGTCPLRRVEPEWIEHMQNGSTRGRPDSWSYFGGSIRLYPRPDAAYVLVIYGQALEDPPTDPAYSGVWVNQAQDLIRFRAKADLLANVIRDNPEETGLARAQEAEILQSLLADRNLASLGTVWAYDL